MKKNAWKIILAIAVLVCIVCLGRFGWIKYQDHKTEQARKEIWICFFPKNNYFIFHS